MVATAEARLTAVVEVFFGARRECPTAPRRPLPVVLAKRHLTFLAGKSLARIVPISIQSRLAASQLIDCSAVSPP